jgi:hypothetical protein
MGIAQMAVMPLQVLVDFFAPQGQAHQAQPKLNPGPASSVYWARERLAQPASLAVTRPITRPISKPIARPSSRVSRTGFAVGTSAGQNPQCSRSEQPVRMRRSGDAQGDRGQHLAGRMVIAGRMRDVCAALNGLAD